MPVLDGGHWGQVQVRASADQDREGGRPAPRHVLCPALFLTADSAPAEEQTHQKNEVLKSSPFAVFHWIFHFVNCFFFE